jgi:hypothetical protein
MSNLFGTRANVTWSFASPLARKTLGQLLLTH